MAAYVDVTAVLAPLGLLALILLLLVKLGLVKMTPHKPTAPARDPLGIRVVMISDTHGMHRQVDVPAGDLLIHAGDFTRFGRESDLTDFNAWLGELPHEHKIVVNGNHEHNAAWKAATPQRLSNATSFLRNQAVSVPLGPKNDLQVYGTDFFWPMKTKNPYYDLVPEDVDILVCHGPVKGYVDGDSGCEELRRLVERVKPRLVISGHIHGAHGVVPNANVGGAQVTFVNAANARKGHGDMGWPAEVIDI